MSKTSQREKTYFKQGFDDGKLASKGIFSEKYYRNSTTSRFYRTIAPMGYARGWKSGLTIE